MRVRLRSTRPADVGRRRATVLISLLAVGSALAWVALPGEALARKILRPPFVDCDKDDAGTIGINKSKANCSAAAGAVVTYATAMLGSCAAEATQYATVQVDMPTTIHVEAAILRMGGKVDVGLAEFSGTYKVLVIDNHRKTQTIDDPFSTSVAIDKAVGFLSTISGLFPGSTIWELIDNVGTLYDMYSLYQSFKDYESAGNAEEVLISDDYWVPQPGPIEIYAGLRSQAAGAILGTGSAFAFGQVHRITVDNVDPPAEPTVVGPELGHLTTTFVFEASNPGNGEDVRYTFTWGDGSAPEVTGWIPGGTRAQRLHTFSAAGSYAVQVKVEEQDMLSAQTVHYVTVLPPLPSTFGGWVTASDGTSCSTVDVAWNNAPYSVSHWVWIDYPRFEAISPEIPNDAANCPEGDCAWVDHPTPGERRRYIIRAKLFDGTFQYSTSGDWGYATGQPAAPDSLWARRSCHVDVEWSWVEWATSFEIWRNTTPNFATAARLATVGQQWHYEDSPPLAYTPYYYWVVAKNACGSAPPAGPAVNSRLGQPVPPPNLTASQDLCDGVHLDWSPSGPVDAVEYWIYRDGSYIGYTGSATDYVDALATPGVVHSYQVVAEATVCQGGQNSSTVTGRRGSPSASAPQDVSASDELFCGMIRVTWSPVSGADSYTICRDNWPSSTWQVTGTSYDDGVAYGSSHRYTVTANHCGASPAAADTGRTAGPPRFATVPMNTTVCEGEDATLSVSVIGLGPYQYQWYSRLDAGGTIFQPIAGAVASAYSVQVATQADEKLYACRASNTCGDRWSAEGKLEVETAPSILQQPVSVTACDGGPARIAVSVAYDREPPSFQWFFDGMPIPGATSEAYAIEATGPGDVGTYWVEIMHMCGTLISNPAQLSLVPAGVAILEQPRSTFVSPGDSVSLHVTGVTSPPIGYRWRRNGTPLTGSTATSARYVISAFAPEDVGTYDVVVWGPCGMSVSGEATLTAALGPRIYVADEDLLQDAFPQSGTLDLGNRPALAIRLDAARDVGSPLGPIEPADGLTAEIRPMSAGGSIVHPPDGMGGRLVWALLANPLFDDLRVFPAGAVPRGLDARGWWLWEGSVAGTPALQNGIPIPDTYSFLLPDAQFFFPGDVLHCYVEAFDTGGYRGTLPADDTDFYEFGADSRFDPNFTVHGLPTLDASLAEGQPAILVWNDRNNLGSGELYRALRQLGLRPGVDFDLYTTRAPHLAQSNGLGSAGAHGAAPAQLERYQALIYHCGGLATGLLSDGSGIAGNDKSQDISLLQAWHAMPGPRHHAYFGANLVESLAATPTGSSYLSGVLGAGLRGACVFSATGDWGVLQAAPTQAGGPCLTMPYSVRAERFIPQSSSGSGYPRHGLLDEFDWVMPVGAAVQGHQFLKRNGSAYSPPLAASVWWDRQQGGARKVTAVFPFGIDRIHLFADQGDGRLASARLLENLIACWGVPYVGGAPSAAPVPRSLAIHLSQNHPNPFNPRTTLTFELAEQEHVRLRIHDTAGRHVATLLDEARMPGRHEVIWNGCDATGRAVASGIYLATLEARGQRASVRMVLVR